MNRRRAWLGAGLLAVAVAALIPLLVRGYLLREGINLLVVAALAVSFDFLRRVGLVNLGHTTFFAIGAYVTAITIVEFGIHPLLGIGLGMIGVVIYSVAVGFPLLRLEGGYFTMATLALVLLVHRLAFNLESVTGGWRGVQVTSPIGVLESYYLFLVCLIGIILVHYIVGKTKYGIGFAAIKHDESVASIFGVQVQRFKMYAFVMNGILSGFIGTLYVLYIGSIVPDSVLGLGITFLPATAALFGGPGTFLGPLIGSLVLGFVDSLLATYIGGFTLFMYGLILVLVGIYTPKGVVNTVIERYPWMPQLSTIRAPIDDD